MGWLDRLFGGGGSADGGGPLEPYVQGESGAEVHVKRSTISHAFVVLTPGDLHHADRAAGMIAMLNEHCQPRVWDVPIHARFVTLSAAPIGNGFPAVDSIGAALEDSGLAKPYSLVVNTLTITLDQGASHSKVLAGFSFREQRSRLIMPRDDGCAGR